MARTLSSIIKIREEPRGALHCTTKSQMHIKRSTTTTTITNMTPTTTIMKEPTFTRENVYESPRKIYGKILKTRTVSQSGNEDFRRCSKTILRR